MDCDLEKTLTTRTLLTLRIGDDIIDSLIFWYCQTLSMHSYLKLCSVVFTIYNMVWFSCLIARYFSHSMSLLLEVCSREI